MMLRHEDYTVGWICGITTEYVAAQSFLDRTHASTVEVSANDNNDYTLGEIGNHNVVIAVLPNGEYGIASVASVARDMLHTFPNIRIGLLVGIGGGAPSKKHDIRLGDVVVSIPSSKASGSVLHYDFSKAVHGHKFEIIGYLNLPPPLLRAASNGLKAKYESDGHKIQESIDRALQKKPRLRKKYMRPDQSSDRLYRSDIVHPLSQDEVSCASLCSDDPSNLVRRLDRGEHDDNPAIHYGLIASADQLVKDAAIRDKLVAEKEILCFETQAAGLMNHFPCLIIRGICDYSDSHGNTAWQGYAAMAAAAYAKDLLSRIPVSKIQAEKKICEILSGVQEGVSKLLHVQHSQQEEAILNWLSPIDYAPIQMDHIARRQSGTGQWFLNSAEYQTWLKGDRQTLFCPGIPGAGKTIITAIVVDDIHSRFHNDTTVGISYLYCDYRRQHTARELLSSLVRQLAQRQASVPDGVSEIYRKYQKQPRGLSLDEMVTLLHSVSKLFSRVFVIVDALDECRADSRTELLDKIFKLQARGGTSIFMTARFIPDIVNIFSESVTLEIRAHDEDVRRFLTHQMTRLPPFVLKDTALQREIKTAISKAVDGMFLLAPLHMDALSQEPTIGHIELALQKLPQGIDEMYDKAMTRVESQGGGTGTLAKKILAWVIHAKRSLSPTELQHAVAVESGTSELNRKFLPSIDVMSTICGGLITIDFESDAVRLVHYTTQQYFERTQGGWSLHQTDIATACITYLSFSTFESGYCPTQEAFGRRLREHPLYYYAARHWGHHSCESLACFESAMEFLRCKAKVEAASQALMAWRVPLAHVHHAYTYPHDYMYYRPLIEDMTGLHLAAYFGLEETVRALSASHDPDVRDSEGRTPLWYAAQNGHKAVVQLLLDTKTVDVNGKHLDRHPPLYEASENGHEAVVELLLKQAGIRADGIGREGTPLWIAAYKGHVNIVKMLLESDDVDINFRSSYSGQTPLSKAAEKGHKAVVDLLLAQPDINPNSRPPPRVLTPMEGYGCDRAEGYVSPLSLAAENGHEEVVRQLLAHPGIDPNCRPCHFGDMDGTPLWLAARHGHDGVVKLLLAHPGVEPSAEHEVIRERDNPYYFENHTPLSIAAKYGHEAVVRLLLTPEEGNHRCTAEHVHGSGRTAPLFAAATVDLQDRPRRLRTNIERSVLSYAAENGNEAIVAMLLATERASKNGSTVNCRSSSERRDFQAGLTALSFAASRGHEAIVRLLLAVEGIDINSQGCGGNTALMLAAENGHGAVVQLLLTAEGINVNLQDCYGQTAILLAAKKGHTAVVRRLLAIEGVDVNSTTRDGQTALMLAAENGRLPWTNSHHACG
ncbi:ankyrin repeat-containing domain protein [Trichoderma aethiopicum]